MKHYWFIKILPFYVGQYEDTGEYYMFKNWVENVIDVYAQSLSQAKEVAALSGIIENKHYNDVIEEIGKI